MRIQSSRISWYMACVWLSSASFSYATPVEEYSAYCRDKGGTVAPMTTWYATPKGTTSGWTQLFCMFERDHGVITIGLETFASPQANIAATYMQTLPEIGENSPLFKGHAGNPSYNVCQNLGGTAISYKLNGTFRGDSGESDICVFGDGSMVSAWSLIYMANHRQGYDEVKASVRSSPLPLLVSP